MLSYIYIDRQIDDVCLCLATEDDSFSSLGNSVQKSLFTLNRTKKYQSEIIDNCNPYMTSLYLPLSFSLSLAIDSVYVMLGL